MPFLIPTYVKRRRVEGARNAGFLQFPKLRWILVGMGGYESAAARKWQNMKKQENEGTNDDDEQERQKGRRRRRCEEEIKGV